MSTAIVEPVSPLAAYEHNVLSISTETPAEVLLTMLDLAETYAARLKEIRKALEDAAIEWVKANGPVHISPEQFYYVGREKKAPKCVSVRNTLEAILNACGGDVDAVVEHLSANALKYGECKQTLGPDEYPKHFVVEEVDKLKASPELEKLLKCDRRFMR